MMFRDQVGIVAGWFKGWNECEQTVALLSLLKRVTRTQARFLQLCLEHSLADCADIHLLEAEANSAGEWELPAPALGAPFWPTHVSVKGSRCRCCGSGWPNGLSVQSVGGELPFCVV